MIDEKLFSRVLARTFALLCFVPAMVSHAAPAAPPGWKLVWHDEFSGDRIDNRKWSPCERNTPDWCNTMTRDPRCYQISGGTLRLMGIVNDDLSKDPSPFLTGGITSKGKFDFTYGRVEIRARFRSAMGAWPALWMLGKNGRWPHNGEIDIMEHLNFDDKVYQTIHSYWANEVDKQRSVPKGGTSPVPRDEFNTYGVEWSADEIVFLVNDKPTFRYPRLADKGPEQWPFDQPFYLILSMQIGGKWVGEADPADYPAWLEIDWVRVFQRPQAAKPAAEAEAPAAKPAGEAAAGDE